MQLKNFLPIISALLPLTMVVAIPIAVPNDSGSHLDDIVSNSVSPVSNNAAGNGNVNTGTLDGNTLSIRKNKRDDSHMDDVVSNSLSPGSDNVAGDNNKNTGTLDGNSLTVAPVVDPTVNLRM